MVFEMVRMTFIILVWALQGNFCRNCSPLLNPSHFAPRTMPSTSDQFKKDHHTVLPSSVARVMVKTESQQNTLRQFIPRIFVHVPERTTHYRMVQREMVSFRNTRNIYVRTSQMYVEVRVLLSEYLFLLPLQSQSRLLLYGLSRAGPIILDYHAGGFHCFDRS